MIEPTPSLSASTPSCWQLDISWHTRWLYTLHGRVSPARQPAVNGHDSAHFTWAAREGPQSVWVRCQGHPQAPYVA